MTVLWLFSPKARAYRRAQRAIRRNDHPAAVVAELVKAAGGAA